MTPLQHLHLLLRFDRTFNLRRAIDRTILPGNCVLDAGCGLGVLSQWAVKAGAKKVVAVDLDDLSLAKSLARENQTETFIEFHRADLTHIAKQMPELTHSFDAIIAMVYLNDPRRDEPQTNFVCQLRDELLKPSGRMIPDQVIYEARLYEWPNEDWRTRLDHLTSQVRTIEERYELGFQELLSHLTTAPSKDFFPLRRQDGQLDRAGSRLLGKGNSFVMDYTKGVSKYPAEVEFEVAVPGIANVVVWTQKIMFDQTLIFSNESMSWLETPQRVSLGDQPRAMLDDLWRSRNLMNVS